MLSSQSPDSANVANAASVTSAARTPPKRQHEQRAGGGRTEPGQPEQEPVEPVDEVVDGRREAVEEREDELRCPACPFSVRSHTWKSSRCAESEFQTSESGHGYSTPSAGRDRRAYISATIAATWTSCPRHHGRCETTGARRWRGLDDRRHQSSPPSPAIASSTATRSTMPTTRPSSTAQTGFSLDARTRIPRAARSSTRRASARRVVCGLRLPHDPAQRQHVAARDVADEVRHVLVRGRADDLLRRSELDDRLRRA